MNIYIYSHIAPRLICSHNFAQIFGPNLLETGDFLIGKGWFEKHERSKRCTKCCPVFWGRFHYKIGEKWPFLSKFVATDRSRATYIYIYMPLDRFAAYIFAVFWFGSLSQISCALRELRWSFCLVLVLSHHPQSFPSSQCLLLILIVCSGCRFFSDAYKVLRVM